MAASASIPRVTVFSSIAALLLSVLLLIGGNALIGVTTPLRARIDGFPDLTIGLLGSAYFAGMLAGTLAAPVDDLHPGAGCMDPVRVKMVSQSGALAK